MLNLPYSQYGVSLVELLIAIVIFGILIAAGAPSFSAWIQSTQVRTAAESVQNGLQLARAEAVRRNALVRFQLTDNSGLASWTVGCVPPATASCPDLSIQSRSANEGGTNARVGVSTATPPSPVGTYYSATALAAGASLPASVTFNGLGRTANVANNITRVDVTNAVDANARRLVLVVSSPGGQTRMCDPSFTSASDPQGC